MSTDSEQIYDKYNGCDERGLSTVIFVYSCGRGRATKSV